LAQGVVGIQIHSSFFEMAEALSKSAKKRAAKKARDGAEAEAPAAAPAPAPKAEPKSKAEPKAKPEPKAKAEPKAEAKATPKAKAAQPKPAAKKAVAPKVEEAPKKKESLELNPSALLDDGTGGDWDMASGLSKKNQRRGAKKAEDERLSKEQIKRQEAIAVSNQHIPGMSAPAAAQMSQSKTAQIVSALASAGAAGATEADKKPTERMETISVSCPDEKIGRVIGPKGANLKLIQEKTGISKIDSSDGVFTATGKPEQVAIAEVALKELIEKGYTSLAYENFSDMAVMVHPSAFPDLIGSGGVIIRKMKEALKVEVNIPPVPKNAPPGKKYAVTIAGKKEDAENAKKVIEDIVMFYHHPITHEGMEHLEMQIDPWSYSYLIGTKGSELRHIQKTFDVKVYIPRDNSVNENVVVVGSKHNCDRTKAYIEKSLAKAAEPRGRDSKDKADDHWGDEEEEPWMKDYLYKRKK